MKQHQYWQHHAATPHDLQSIVSFRPFSFVLISCLLIICQCMFAFHFLYNFIQWRKSSTCEDGRATLTINGTAGAERNHGNNMRREWAKANDDNRCGTSSTRHIHRIAILSSTYQHRHICMYQLPICVDELHRLHLFFGAVCFSFDMLLLDSDTDNKWCDTEQSIVDDDTIIMFESSSLSSLTCPYLVVLPHLFCFYFLTLPLLPPTHIATIHLWSWLLRSFAPPPRYLCRADLQSHGF